MQQVSLNLPDEVIREAERVAEFSSRPDGLKNNKTKVLRDWMLNGFRASKESNRGSAQEA